jgi:hypothetical protein
MRARINADLSTATSRATKLQSTAAYDKTAAATAISKTVTSGAATSHEQAVEKANAKLKAKTKTKSKKSSASTAAAKKAGLSAASKIKASQSATTSGKVHQAAKSATYSKSSATRASTSTKKSAVSKKTPVARGAAKGIHNLDTLTTNDDMWFGAEHTSDCVPVSIANHMLFVDGYRATNEQVAELAERCGHAPTIKRGLQVAASMARRGAWPAVPKFAPCRGLPLPGCIVGYEAMTDSGRRPHAALLTDDGCVVSWGGEYALDTAIEEAWIIRWSTRTKI